LKFDPIDDPGYDLNKGRVDRYNWWLERYGVLPDELDRQDKRVVRAIELRATMKAKTQREYSKEHEEKQATNDGSLQ